MARLNHPMEMCALRLWAPLLIWQCVGTAAAANNEELARDRPDGVESGTLLMRNDDDRVVATRLLRTAVRMQVTGLINRVTVRQQFRNDTDEWMEAIYVLPLPANAAVDHLHMQIGERIIKGVVSGRGTLLPIKAIVAQQPLQLAWQCSQGTDAAYRPWPIG